MPDITQRIADIIGEHYYAATIQGPMCWCGATLSGIDQHPAHVAEVLTTELGLTEETAFRFTHNESGRSSILTEPGDVHVAQKITESHTLVEVSRYVTDWVCE